MNTEQKLSKYIINKYKPKALLIHGSRSNGYAREHSDWDFAIIVTDDIEIKRKIFAKANIEVRVLKLPFNEDNIDGKWLVLRKDNTRILFDPNNLSENIIEKVTAFYNKPREFDPSYKNEHKAWFRSQLDGMIDYQYEQEAFFRKLGELYLRVIQYWFHFLNLTYMPQVYKSLPQIKNKDPEYYKLLKVLSNNFTNQEKIQAAEDIYHRIWQ